MGALNLPDIHVYYNHPQPPMGREHCSVWGIGMDGTRMAGEGREELPTGVYRL